MNIHIPRVNYNPPDADVRFLEDRIAEYNVETTGITDGRILSFFIRDERQEIVAGLFGWTWGGACEIRDLWVREDMRKHGYGKALMVAAEDEAVLRGCTLVALDTHSFQAPAFYQRLGFEIIGSHRDLPARPPQALPAKNAEEIMLLPGNSRQSARCPSIRRIFLLISIAASNNR